MKAHRIDIVSLIFGLVFAGLAAWWGLSQIVDLPSAAAGWVAAFALLALGVTGIATSVMSHRSRPVAAEPGSMEFGDTGSSEDPLQR